MENIQKYCTYCRVSTREQGESGLGLDAQLTTCRDFVASKEGEIIGEFHDVKSGSSRTRTGLLAALAKAKETNAILVFAKLDRLARDAEYAFSVKNSGIELYFCDFPEINLFMFGVLVSFAQYERELGQKRTKDALSAIKDNIAKEGYHTSKKGNAITHLGGYKGWEHTEEARLASARAKEERIRADVSRRRQFLLIKELRVKGSTLDEIATTMNIIGEKTPEGKEWSKATVSVAINSWGRYFE